MVWCLDYLLDGNDSGKRQRLLDSAGNGSSAFRGRFRQQEETAAVLYDIDLLSGGCADRGTSHTAAGIDAGRGRVFERDPVLDGMEGVLFLAIWIYFDFVFQGEKGQKGLFTKRKNKESHVGSVQYFMRGLWNDFSALPSFGYGLVCVWGKELSAACGSMGE